MTDYRFSIRVEKHPEGYAAFCSELQGCYAQGDTYEAALSPVSCPSGHRAVERPTPSGAGAVSISSVSVRAP